MEKIAKELQAWLPNLWLVGVDKAVEQSLVHKSLKFIKASEDKVGSCNSRYVASANYNSERVY